MNRAEPAQLYKLMGLGVFGQGLYINPVRHIVTVRFSSLPAHSVVEYSKGWNDIRLWMDEVARAPR